MRALFNARPVRATAFAFAAVLGLAGPALAADFDYVIPKGTACPNFDLRAQGTGGNLVTKEWLDENGKVVKSITGGKGFQLTFTNVSKPANVLTLKSSGSVTKTAYNNSDATSTMSIMGHNVLIMYPTDVPPGPTTTLYVGRVSFTIDANQVFTILTTSGKSTDICAALA
ncbi:hypothetical protein [Variovorax sp. J22R115]|uniref:hypothetical protein n=1 Tax=Variovorax sp. J22R115 TaxID=3053509 RepID=UPI0025754344|nr:hypothetical protein [Variovorax sp. J22R115]MDM0048989.1 hypothetical protein [Variovorax sp. J22R115]